MAKVEIMPTLEKQINRIFKDEALDIFKLCKTLETQPKKGKLLSVVKGVAIKELKYKTYRFYFIVDNYKITFLTESKLKDVLIKFVKLSKKDNQQGTIEQIKKALRRMNVSHSSSE